MNAEASMKLERDKFATRGLIIFLLIVSAAFFSYNFRIVRTLDGIRIVEKSETGFQQIYVDMSDWTIRDLFANRQITMEVIRSGHASGIPQIAAFNHAVEQSVQSIKDFDRRYGISDSFDWTVEKMKEIDDEN